MKSKNKKVSFDLGLLPHQYEIITDTTTKVLGLVGGYGSGKTYTACIKALTLVLANNGGTGIITEPSYSLLSDILVPTFINILENLNLKYIYKKKASNGEGRFIFNFNGVETTVLLLSMQNITRIIGYNANWVISDEFDTLKTDIAFEGYTKLRSRIRGQGKIKQYLITTTPEGYKAAYKIFVEDKSEQKRLVKAKTSDNVKMEGLDEYISSLKDTLPPQLLKAFLDGEFVNLTQGSVYKEFSRDKHVIDNIDYLNNCYEFFIGCDFNIQKTACVICIKDLENNLIIVDELIDLYNTFELVEKLKIKFNNDLSKCNIYPDASGRNRYAGSTTSNIDVLNINTNFKSVIYNQEGNPPVIDTINLINVNFFNNRIKVCKRANNLISSLEKQAYDKKGEPDKSLGIDHILDSFRYVSFFNFKQNDFYSSRVYRRF